MISKGRNAASKTPTSFEEHENQMWNSSVASIARHKWDERIGLAARATLVSPPLIHAQTAPMLQKVALQRYLY